MKVHMIIDFMYLYYKYKFTYESGRLRRLTTRYQDGSEVDVTMVYYPIKEIEGIRRGMEKEGHEVTLSICMDSPSKRKEEDKEYKANRKSKLTSDDLQVIEVIETLLNEAGYNVFRVEGEEADDIVANLLDEYAGEFNHNIIYTPDADLMVHIKNGVAVNRYKTRDRKYTAVGVRNFSDICRQEFKCYIPFNGMLMYKSLCADKSDNIKGVKGFGPKSFDRYVDWLGDNVDWELMSSEGYCRQVLENSRGYLGDAAVEQALQSLGMVAYHRFNPGELSMTTCGSTRDKRESAYSRLKMFSLID